MPIRHVARVALRSAAGTHGLGSSPMPELRQRIHCVPKATPRSHKRHDCRSADCSLAELLAMDPKEFAYGTQARNMELTLIAHAEKSFSLCSPFHAMNDAAAHPQKTPLQVRHFECADSFHTMPPHCRHTMLQRRTLLPEATRPKAVLVTKVT